MTLRHRSTFFALAALGCLLLAVLPLSAHAQVVDNFSGGLNPAVPWRWDVPGNTPLNTKDPSRYGFTASALRMDFPPSTLFQTVNSARNVLNLAVTQQPTDWFVETSFVCNFDSVNFNGFPQVNFSVFSDADNYFNYHYVRNAGSNTVGMSSNVEVAGAHNFGGFSAGTGSPTANPQTMRIQGNASGSVTFLYDTGNGAGLRTLTTLTGTDTGVRGLSYSLFASGLVGKRVGVYLDFGGGNVRNSVFFDRFATNLAVPIAQVPEPGAVTLFLGLAAPGAALLLRRRRAR